MSNYGPCVLDCTKCSGEYCEQHGADPCDCDVIERHRIPCGVCHGSGKVYMRGPIYFGMFECYRCKGTGRHTPL